MSASGCKEQGRNEDQKGHCVQHRHKESTGQELPNTTRLLQVLHKYASRDVLEEGDWQTEEVPEGFRRHSNVDFIGRVKQKVTSKKAEDCVKSNRDRRAGRQHIERREALVHKDFVNDELKNRTTARA